MEILKILTALIEALSSSGLAAVICAVIASKWGGLKQTPQPEHDSATRPPNPTQ